MKKLIIPVLLLCLLLTACAPNTNPIQPSGTHPASSSVTTLPTGSVHITQRLNGFYTYDEYRKFVEETELPDNFVYYENLTAFGPFCDLMLPGIKPDPSTKPAKYEAADICPYSYGFKDGNGNLFYLTIGTSNGYTEVESKCWGDMRLWGSFFGGNEYVVRNGVAYIYRLNELHAIAWESNGIPFMLVSEAKGGVFYPDDGPVTIIHELLHTDTNKAALEKINAALETPAVK